MAATWIQRLNESAQPNRLPRQPTLPEEQLGHCMVCGATFREYIECEEPDCNFVRDQQQDNAA